MCAPNIQFNIILKTLCWVAKVSVDVGLADTTPRLEICRSQYKQPEPSVENGTKSRHNVIHKSPYQIAFFSGKIQRMHSVYVYKGVSYISTTRRHISILTRTVISVFLDSTCPVPILVHMEATPYTKALAASLPKHCTPTLGGHAFSCPVILPLSFPLPFKIFFSLHGFLPSPILAIPLCCCFWSLQSSMTVFISLLIIHKSAEGNRYLN